MTTEHSGIDAAIQPAGQHEEHHEIDLARIAGMLVILTIATSSTLLLQSFAAGIWSTGTNILFTLSVSICKASLVVGFFMHFKFERIWKFFVCIPPCILMFVLAFGLMPDIAQPFHLYTRIAWNQ